MSKVLVGLVSVLVAAAIVLCSFASPVFSDNAKSKSKDQTSEKKQTTKEKVATPSPLPGVKVGRDPDGGLRPTTPAEDQKLINDYKKNAKGFQKHQAKIDPNGTISLVVAPEFVRMSVVRKAADGSLVFDCVDTPEKAAKLLKEKPADKKVEEQ